MISIKGIREVKYERHKCNNRQQTSIFLKEKNTILSMNVNSVDSRKKIQT